MRPLLWAVGLVAMVGIIACAGDMATVPLPTDTPTPPVTMKGTATLIPTPLATKVFQATPTPTRRLPWITPIGGQEGHFRLVDSLDNAQGYCLDVPGFGDSLRVETPLQVHTCKPGAFDQVFYLEWIGTEDDAMLSLLPFLSSIYPSHCVAVHMRNGLTLTDCSRRQDALRWMQNGFLIVNLLPGHPQYRRCVGVAGGPGQPAGGPGDLRRDLVLYDCELTAAPLITWEFVRVTSEPVLFDPLPDTSKQIRLINGLDDPTGYCVDVVGFGENLRLDAPLQAHTCKYHSDDQLFAFVDNGDDVGIELADYDLCLTASALEPGASITLEPCDSTLATQHFRWLDGQRIYLLATGTPDDFGFCLGITVGPGEPAGGRNHLRRDLTMYECYETEASLTGWEPFNP